jgi:hypothetical protein
MSEKFRICPIDGHQCDSRACLGSGSRPGCEQWAREISNALAEKYAHLSLVLTAENYHQIASLVNDIDSLSHTIAADLNLDRQTFATLLMAKFTTLVSGRQR